MYGGVSIYPIQVFKNLLKNRLFATVFASVGLFLVLRVDLRFADKTRSTLRKLQRKASSSLAVGVGYSAVAHTFCLYAAVLLALSAHAKALSLHRKDYCFLFS